MSDRSGEGRVALTVRVAPEERNAFRAWCGSQGKSMQECVREYMRRMGLELMGGRSEDDGEQG